LEDKQNEKPGQNIVKSV